MKLVVLSSLLLLCLSSFAAGPAVLFEEVEVSSEPTTTTTAPSPNPARPSRVQSSNSQEITPLSQRSSLRDIYAGQEFDSVFEMRAKRRVGVGASALGATGLFGALLELNFGQKDSLMAAFGGGPGYGAFGFQWKHLFTGRVFSPYAGVGYARWYNASGDGKNMERTTPNVLASKFLDDEERRSGKFGVNLITPTLGLQYSFLAGPWTGTALFGEINFLTSFENLSPAPVAGIGGLYYF